MKSQTCLYATLFCLIVRPCLAENVLLRDDFNRSEANDALEDLGGEWLTNSQKRAKGVKQADLVDGVLHITRAEVADHGVSVVHDLRFKDATVKLRFKIREQDELGINIADMNEKSVHAGHLFVTKIRTNYVEVIDLKTGTMKREIRDRRKAGKVDEATTKMLATKKKRFNRSTSANQWHDLEIQIKADSVTVLINNEMVGSFSSPGISHPTKSRLRLAVAKQAWIDDLVVTTP